MSKIFKLGKDDVISVLKGAGIAALGACVVYLSTWLTGQDFGEYTAAVAALAAVLVNLVRKYITNTE